MSSRKRQDEESERTADSSKRSRFGVSIPFSGRGATGPGTSSSVQPHASLHVDQQHGDASNVDSHMEQSAQPPNELEDDTPEAAQAYSTKPSTGFRPTSPNMGGSNLMGRAFSQHAFSMTAEAQSQRTEPDVSSSFERSGSEQSPHRLAGDASTRKGVHLATKLFEKAAGACKIGPLQDISNMLQGFADMHITEGKVKNEHQALQQRLRKLLQAVEERSDDVSSLVMMSKVEGIREFVKGELDSLENKRSNKPHGRLLTATKDEERFLACCHRVQEYMDRLSIEAQQSMDRMSSLIDCLPASPSAWYNSRAGEELKRRECTAGTRIDVIAHLLDWAGARSDGTGGVYWLNGMAGTGKTTIAYSVCKMLDDELKLAASFFCSRLREECRDVNMIIPSIAYQLARFSLPIRSALLSTLEKDPKVYTKRLDMQFKALIEDPLLAIKNLPTEGLVVVIDALDECEDKESTRSILDLLLSKTTNLPIRLIITSRPEPQIRDEMTSQRTRSRLVLHELDKGEVQADIEKYLREGLAQMDPSGAQIAALVEKAGILFIYAATAVRYVGYDNFRSDPTGRLGDILDGPQSTEDAANEEIDKLYTTVLEGALGNRAFRKVQRDDMRRILYTVICAREPLTVRSLSELLGIKDAERVRTALRPLWSVLHVIEGREIVTTLHASFPDFMLDSARSNTYWCDSNAQHRRIAEHCFEHIRHTKPQFNICGLESSYLSDRKVPDIDKRVADAASSELLYACRYWSDHVQVAKCASSVLDQLQNFLSTRLLLWMEVLNLSSQMKAAIECVTRTAEWCAGLEGNQELAALADDAKRFVEAFASNPVSQSTPHIYVSMLAFWPKFALVTKHYAKYTRGPVVPQGTALDQRQLAHLSTWAFKGRFWGIAVSLDGLHAALGIDKDVVVVELSSGRVVTGPLTGHTDRIPAVGFTADGSTVLVGSCNGKIATILSWDTRTGNQVLGPLQLHGHTDYIWCLTFSSDCSRTATGSLDKTVRLWDAQTGKTLLRLEVQGQIEAVVFSPDGTRVAAGYGKTVQIWDSQSGHNIHGPVADIDLTKISLIALSPDNSRVICAHTRNKTIQVGDVQGSGIVFRQIAEHPVHISFIAYSPDGKHVVSGSADGAVRLWDVQTGNMVLGPLKGHTSNVTAFAFTPDGSRVISACFGGLICTWDAQQRSLVPSSTSTPFDPITCVKFSPDGAHFVSGSNKGTICIWDAYTAEIVAGPVKVHTSGISVVDVKNGHLVSGSTDGEICVCDALTGQVVLGPLKADSGAVWVVAYSPNGKLIVTGSSDGVNVWNAQDGSRMLGPLTDLQGGVESVQFSPDGTRIVASSVGSSSNMVVWYVSDGSSVFGTLDGHHGSVRSVSYSPNGALIASGSHDNTIIVWDAYTGKKAIGPLTGHSHLVLSVSFSPDSTRLVSGSFDGTIRIWGVQTGEMVFELSHGHQDGVISVEYSPDGTRIMSRSDDGSVGIHDGRSPGERAQSRSKSEVGDWTMNKDGWVVDDESNLLVWVPGDLRKALVGSGTHFIIARQGYVGLMFDKSRMGESWARGYTSQM